MSCVFDVREEIKNNPRKAVHLHVDTSFVFKLPGLVLNMHIKKNTALDIMHTVFLT